MLLNVWAYFDLSYKAIDFYKLYLWVQPFLESSLEGAFLFLCKYLISLASLLIEITKIINLNFNQH